MAIEFETTDEHIQVGDIIETSDYRYQIMAQDGDGKLHLRRLGFFEDWKLDLHIFLDWLLNKFKRE